MTKEMRDLLAKIEAKTAEAKQLQADGKFAECKAALDEVEILKVGYDNAKKLYDAEKGKVSEEQLASKVKDNLDGFKAMAKMILRKPLTEAEAALITGGSSGEDNLVPDDVRTAINELRREHKSMKDFVTVITTDALSGSFVFENGGAGTLTNFTDGQDVATATDPTFRTEPFTIAWKGEIIPISNILLKFEKAGLLPYLNNWFVKKAVNTENTDIFTLLKSSKTTAQTKTYHSVADIRSSKNKDLDPSVLTNAVIITNQTGFDLLDSETDKNGRPLLKEYATEPGVKHIDGIRIEVFSDSQLANVSSGTAPVFIGDFKAATYFIEAQGLTFATSEHVFFNKNQNAMRIIEGYDVIKADTDAYVYGKLSAAPASNS